MFLGENDNIITENETERSVSSGSLFLHAGRRIVLFLGNPLQSAEKRDILNVKQSKDVAP